MTSPILSPDDLATFEETGFLTLREAFPRDAALSMQDFMWEQLAERNGIDRNDRTTWDRTTHGLNRKTRHPNYEAVASPRMCGALDQLLGAGAWTKPQGWGGFLVSFPRDADQRWDVASGQWHWDGDPNAHLDGMKAAFVFTFYSDVKPGGGGTLVISGSHRLALSFVEGLNPDDRQRKQKTLKKRFMQSNEWLAELTGHVEDKGDRVRRFMDAPTEIDGVPVRVVELTGQPGDAAICHPSLFHSPSQNRGETPRFMRVKAVWQEDAARRV